MTRRVVITGIGLVTPLAVGLRNSWKKLISGESGLISTSILPGYEEDGWNQIPSKVVGRVPQGPIEEGKWTTLDHFEHGESKRLALFTQYAMAATNEALKDAHWFPNAREEQNTTGVAIGSGIGSFEDVYNTSMSFYEKGYKRTSPLFIPRMLPNMAAGNVSIKYQLKGPNHSVSTACATGLNSIGDASNFIKNGCADVMVAGGTETSLHPLALAGFARARSVATDFNDYPSKASRPFDKDRSGFVLSEGCGILILEELEHALKRGLKEEDIYAEVKGYGLSGDASHITAPLEDGDGALRAMEMCLKTSDLEAGAVDYINAHATSTAIGDRAENKAILNLFRENKQLCISSSKSAIGHLLGAAGAVELAFTIMSIKDGLVPPTLNLESLGNHKEDNVHEFSFFDYVPNKTKIKPVNNAICNSFGFGGVNCSLCFLKFQ